METLNNIVLVSPGEEASELSPGKEWYSSLVDNLGLVLGKYANAGLMSIPADDGNVLKSIETESTIVFLNTALTPLSEKLDGLDPDDSERYILLNVSNIPVAELPG